MANPGDSPPPLPVDEPLDPLDSGPQAPPLPAAGSGRRRSFWRRPIGIVSAIAIAAFGLVVLAVVAFGVMIELRYLPGTSAVEGSDVRDHVVELLRENDVLEPDEAVRYYYSGGLFSFLEHGSVVTDRRAISYSEDDEDGAEGELIIAAVRFDEIVSIDVEWSDSMLADTIITLTTTEDWELPLYVSNESKGDHEFHRVLEELWQKHR